MSCNNNNLEVAKWLWSLNQNINIHANNEFAFKLSCEDRHIKVVKWLWSLSHNIDIHANNEYAFRWSCNNSNLEVAKWLIKLVEYNKHKLLAYNNITSNKLLQYLIKLKLLRHIKIKKNKNYNKLNKFFIKN